MFLLSWVEVDEAASLSVNRFDRSVLAFWARWAGRFRTRFCMVLILDGFILVSSVDFRFFSINLCWVLPIPSTESDFRQWSSVVSEAEVFIILTISGSIVSRYSWGEDF